MVADAQKVNQVVVEEVKSWTIEDSEKLLQQSQPKKLTPHTLVEIDAIRTAIDKVRKDGYSLIIEELSAGVIGLSVPVRDRRGNVVAAAGLSLNPGRFNKKIALGTYLPKLKEAAKKIELHLA